VLDSPKTVPDDAYNIFVVVTYVNQLSVFDIDFLIVPA
jgi:hypothetical protein